jgi:hypothetical protein
MAETRADYGNALNTPGVLQPTGSINVDAFGLAQAQLTFAIETNYVFTALDYWSAGQLYASATGDEDPYDMKSYKYSVRSDKAGISMITVDFIGTHDNWTSPQVTGVANTTAQPIESHPNFTKKSDLFTYGPLAGKPPNDPDAAGNVPLWVPQYDTTTDPGTDTLTGYKFNGFGVNSAGDINIKAGIRQFLRPMVNVRGQIFFDAANGYRGAAFANGVGQTLREGDLELLGNQDVIGVQSPLDCLLTSCNIELIGNPDNYSVIKVTYDIMLAGDLGWDPDIYREMVDGIL